MLVPNRRRRRREKIQHPVEFFRELVAPVGWPPQFFPCCRPKRSHSVRARSFRQLPGGLCCSVCTRVRCVHPRGCHLANLGCFDWKLRAPYQRLKVCSFAGRNFSDFRRKVTAVRGVGHQFRFFSSFFCGAKANSAFVVGAKRDEIAMIMHENIDSS